MEPTRLTICAIMSLRRAAHLNRQVLINAHLVSARFPDEMPTSLPISWTDSAASGNAETDQPRKSCHAVNGTRTACISRVTLTAIREEAWLQWQLLP